MPTTRLSACCSCVRHGAARIHNEKRCGGYPTSATWRTPEGRHPFAKIKGVLDYCAKTKGLPDTSRQTWSGWPDIPGVGVPLMASYLWAVEARTDTGPAQMLGPARSIDARARGMTWSPSSTARLHRASLSPVRRTDQHVGRSHGHATGAGRDVARRSVACAGRRSPGRIPRDSAPVLIRAYLSAHTAFVHKGAGTLPSNARTRDLIGHDPLHGRAGSADEDVAHWRPGRRTTTYDTRCARAHCVPLARGVYLRRTQYDALDEAGRHRVCTRATSVRLLEPGEAISHVSAAVLHKYSICGRCL